MCLCECLHGCKICMCATCVPDACRSLKREPSAMRGEELNPGILGEQRSILTAEPSLQPRGKI